jgi:hypothetical protein
MKETLRSFCLLPRLLAVAASLCCAVEHAAAGETAIAAETAQAIPEVVKQEAETIWKQRCTTCHGEQGKGDGAAALALTPKPRDLTLASWQSSVTDEHIEKIVAEGGQAVGLSILMPANPDLAGKPDVIKALRARVRALAAP